MLEFPVFLVLKYFFYWDPSCGSFLTTTTGTARTHWVLPHSTGKGADLEVGWGCAGQSSAGGTLSCCTGSCPAAAGQTSYFCPGHWQWLGLWFTLCPSQMSSFSFILLPCCFFCCLFFSLISSFFYPAPLLSLCPHFFSFVSQTNLLKYKAWPLLKGEDVLFLFKLCTCLDVFIM